MRPAALLVPLFLALPDPARACSTGPDFCTDDPRIPDLLAQKKARLASAYPAEFIALLDLGAQCVARIERSPDVFSLMMIDKDGTLVILQWDADNQRAANGKLASGDMARYWIIHTRHAFSCDGEVSYTDRADYDAVDDVNASLAIACREATDCPVAD